MQKNQSAIAGMPKTLLGFYIKYVCHGLWWVVAAFIFCRFIVSLDSVFWPMLQRWVVAMLEDAPVGVNLIQWCMPTILLITIISLTISVFALLRNWAIDSFRPRAENKISEFFTDYVHS